MFPQREQFVISRLLCRLNGNHYIDIPGLSIFCKTGPGEGGETTLQLHLICEYDIEVRLYVELTLVSQKDNGKDHRWNLDRPIQLTDYENEEHKLYKIENFIKTSDLVDPRNAYVVDEKFVLEVRISEDPLKPLEWSREIDPPRYKILSDPTMINFLAGNHILSIRWNALTRYQESLLAMFKYLICEKRGCYDFKISAFPLDLKQVFRYLESPRNFNVELFGPIRASRMRNLSLDLRIDSLHDLCDDYINRSARFAEDPVVVNTRQELARELFKSWRLTLVLKERDRNYPLPKNLQRLLELNAAQVVLTNFSPEEDAQEKPLAGEDVTEKRPKVYDPIKCGVYYIHQARYDFYTLFLNM